MIKYLYLYSKQDTKVVMTAIKFRKIYRTLKIIQEIKTIPYQTIEQLLEKLSVSRAQFYKDKHNLSELGFEFSYDRSKKRFVVSRDAYLPVEGLTQNERLFLMIAARQLSASGDSLLTYEGLNAARKLAVDLPQPLRDQALAIFDDIVLKEGFGCRKEVLEAFQAALAENRRVVIRYLPPNEELPVSYEFEPYHMFFRHRALYVEGYSWSSRDIRMFRMSRIESVQITAIQFVIDSTYRFSNRHQNAFTVYPGESTNHVKVRFINKARPYIMESLWHHSQKITVSSDDAILFEVDIADPREVLWWALGWGADAEILEPDWLREEAIQTIQNMLAGYQPASEKKMNNEHDYL